MNQKLWAEREPSEVLQKHDYMDRLHDETVAQGLLHLPCLEAEV